MTYANAIFFLDYNLGVDTARADLASLGFNNGGGGLIAAAKVAHGLVQGAVVDVTASTNYNGA